MKRNLQEQPEKGSEILFENDELIVAKILTQEAACYYAQVSPWCSENEFSKYNRIGDVYYFIPKNPKSMLKYALFVEDGNKNSYAFRLFGGDEFSVRVLILQFPQVKDIIGELYPFNITKNLEDYIMEIIDGDDLMSLNSSIVDIYTDKRGRGVSELVIRNRDTKEMLDRLLELDHGDILAFNFAQGSYEWLDWDNAYDEYISGYGIYNAYNNETESLLEEISKYLLPNEEFDFNYGDYLELLMREIRKDFPDKIYEIVDDYQEKYNESAREKVKLVVESELKEYFDKIGFVVGDNYEELITTTGNLLYWCRRYDYVGNLNNLIQLIFEKNKSNLEGWSDTANESGLRQGPEKDEFVQKLNRILNNILSTLKKGS